MVVQCLLHSCCRPCSVFLVHNACEGQLASVLHPGVDIMAKFLHCVRTACILRTQRRGYSPKDTFHLSSSTAKQQSPHENNENAFKGLHGRQTSTCRTTHLHMHRFINV